MATMFVDGHKYWLTYKNGSVSYYRCHRHKITKCPGRLIVESNQKKLVVEHDHLPVPNLNLIDKFRKVLTQRAADESTDLNIIYCDEATNRHADAALLYPFTCAESAMRKARRKQIPQNPKKVFDIVNILDGNDLVNILDGNDFLQVKCGSDREHLYQKTFTVNDSTCMIFFHRKTLEIIPRVDEINIDCSFEFAHPNQPIYYLMTFHAVYTHATIPIMFTIITAKTNSAYNAIFHYISNDLKISPNIIVSDFDYIIQTELLRTFPEAIIKGSWYQYTDAVLGQTKRFCLQRETAKGIGASALRMLIVLPLLPPEYMVPGVEAIRKWMREKNIFSSGLSQLTDYVEQTWLRGVGTDKMSIFGTTRVASNHIKNFNKDLANRIGNIPVIWTLLEAIKQVVTKTYVKIRRKLNIDKKNQSYSSTSRPGQRNPSCPRQKRHEVVAEKIVESATQLWIKTPVHLRNPLQFLQLSSHCINDSMYLANLSEVKDCNYTNGMYPKTSSSCAVNSTSTNNSRLPTEAASSWVMIDSNSLQLTHAQKIVSTEPAEQNEQSVSSSAGDFIPTSHMPQDSYNCSDIVINDIPRSNYPSCFAQCSSVASNNLKYNLLTEPKKSFDGPEKQNDTRIVDANNPPPLIFLPIAKQFRNKRVLPILSEPPPLVPIHFKRKYIE